jgi:hypothetical protein
MQKESKHILLILGLTWLATGISFAQDGYGTTFAGEIAFPAGVFGESFKTGYGAHVDFYMESGSNLRLSAILGFTHWGVDEAQINERYVAGGGKGTLQLEGRMNVFPLLVGVKLLSPPGGVRFYGLLEVGVFFFSGKVTGEKLDSGVVIQNIYEQQSKSVAGANLGVGFLLPIGKGVALDIAGRYHLVKRNTYYNYDYAGNATEVNTDKYFSLSVGVTYSFLAQ